MTESDLLDSIMLSRIKRLSRRRGSYPEQGYYTAIEKEARWETWRAYLRRNEGRLFSVGPHEGHNERQWRAMEDQWFGRAIGCVAILERPLPEKGEHDYYPYSFDECVAIGCFMGCSRGWDGYTSFQLGNLTGPGVTLHRSPMNVGYVHILDDRFQRLVEINYRSEEEYEYEC